MFLHKHVYMYMNMINSQNEIWGYVFIILIDSQTQEDEIDEVVYF